MQALSPRAANIAAQAAYHLRVQLRAGQRETVITLDPPGLGRMRLSMRGTGANLTAVLRAELPEVESLLREGADAIRNRLGRQGLPVERLVVESGAARAAAPAPMADQAQWTESLPSFASQDGDARRAWQEGQARDPQSKQAPAQDGRTRSGRDQEAGEPRRRRTDSMLDLTA